MTSPESSSCAPTSSSHIIGGSYDFQQIRTALGGKAAPPNFVIHKDGIILGLCLGIMWHPRSGNDPVEVWVGRKPELVPWGIKLAETKLPLPIYLRREAGGKWVFAGLHVVTGHSTEISQLKARLQPPVITGISRIVFLKRLA